MNIELHSKTALITGGAQGIGDAIAQLFAEAGAKVIILDLKKSARSYDSLVADIRYEDQIAKAIRSLDKLDIVVNSAGVYAQSKVEETSAQLLDTIVDTNLKGSYLVAKHTLPLLRQSRGTLIHIASGLGLVPEPTSPAYCATKAAVIMLMKCLAQEYASVGVRINAILLGPIDTPLLRNSLMTDAELAKYAALIPMKRIGTPENVAHMALFLASHVSEYVTGGLFAVDGGESSSSIYSK